MAKYFEGQGLPPQKYGIIELNHQQVPFLHVLCRQPVSFEATASKYVRRYGECEADFDG